MPWKQGSKGISGELFFWMTVEWGRSTDGKEELEMELTQDLRSVRLEYGTPECPDCRLTRF